MTETAGEEMAGPGELPETGGSPLSGSRTWPVVALVLLALAGGAFFTRRREA
jgi:hypothetical protein